MKELAKQYDPSQVEDRIYQFWLDGGYFHTKADPDKKPYTIVMPPPNVTGQLHMGHAVDNTMQDILIRTKRMQGYAALWVPGTDHASIATEAKVVEAMRAEGLTKEMVGRDGFLELSLIHIYQLGGLITGEVGFNLFTIVAAVVLVGFIYLMVRPNKYVGDNEVKDVYKRQA